MKSFLVAPTQKAKPYFHFVFFPVSLNQVVHRLCFSKLLYLVHEIYLILQEKGKLYTYWIELEKSALFSSFPVRITVAKWYSHWK